MAEPPGEIVAAGLGGEDIPRSSVAGLPAKAQQPSKICGLHAAFHQHKMRCQTKVLDLLAKPNIITTVFRGKLLPYVHWNRYVPVRARVGVRPVPESLQAGPKAAITVAFRKNPENSHPESIHEFIHF
jgi:hypothetical protein